MGRGFVTFVRPAIVLPILFALLLGIVYPPAMTGVGQAFFPHQANGSLDRAERRPPYSEVVVKDRADVLALNRWLDALAGGAAGR